MSSGSTCGLGKSSSLGTKSLSGRVSSVCSDESDLVVSHSGSSAFTNALSSVLELDSELLSRAKVPRCLGHPRYVLSEFLGSRVRGVA